MNQKKNKKKKKQTNKQTKWNEKWNEKQNNERILSEGVRYELFIIKQDIMM